MAEPLTRVRNRCRNRECPWRDSEETHRPWCQGAQDHRCFGGATHQHLPKRGAGGHNPKSRIVAILCAGLHDAVDNGTKYKNAVQTDFQGREVYCLWEKDSGKVLVERVIGSIVPNKEGDRQWHG